ncbi:hypothetical protein COBT_001992 [Conglomerata obtusa]
MQNHIVNPLVFQSNGFLMLLEGETSIDKPVFRKYFSAVMANAEIEIPEESVNNVNTSSSDTIRTIESSNDVNRSNMSEIDFSSELSIVPRFEQGLKQIWL